MDKQVAHVASGEYSQDFAQIVQIIEYNRSQAIQVINHASVLTAWQVGAYVSDKIKNAAWGSKVVQQLAEYIHTQNPTLKGWSKRTIYKMVQFYETYTTVQFVGRATSLKLLSKPADEIVPTESAQIKSSSIVPISSAQIPKFLLRTTWSNHIAIFQDANPEVVCYALNRSISPTMVSKYEEQLKVGSVIQRSLEEFVEFLDK